MQTMNKKVFSVASLDDADDDKGYWLSRSHAERLEAVEQMRQIIYGYDAATERLQRFFEVAQLERR